MAGNYNWIYSARDECENEAPEEFAGYQLPFEEFPRQGHHREEDLRKRQHFFDQWEEEACADDQYDYDGADEDETLPAYDRGHGSAAEHAAYLEQMMMRKWEEDSKEPVDVVKEKRAAILKKAIANAFQIKKQLQRRCQAPNKSQHNPRSGLVEYVLPGEMRSNREQIRDMFRGVGKSAMRLVKPKKKSDGEGCETEWTYVTMNQ